MSEIQETGQIDYLLPYLHDLVQHESERERVKWVESSLRVRFGEEENS